MPSAKAMAAVGGLESACRMAIRPGCPRTGVVVAEIRSRTSSRQTEPQLPARPAWQIKSPAGQGQSRDPRRGGTVAGCRQPGVCPGRSPGALLLAAANPGSVARPSSRLKKMPAEAGAEKASYIPYASATFPAHRPRGQRRGTIKPRNKSTGRLRRGAWPVQPATGSCVSCPAHPFS